MVEKKMIGLTMGTGQGRRAPIGSAWIEEGLWSRKLSWVRCREIVEVVRRFYRVEIIIFFYSFAAGHPVSNGRPSAMRSVESVRTGLAVPRSVIARSSHCP
jgi:hypothetical protein